MLHRRIHAVLLTATLLAAPGCFATRMCGLGPDPGPDEIVKDDTPQQIYEKAQRLYAAQQWPEAAKAFEKIHDDFPKSELACDAQYYEAEARFHQGKLHGAFELYKSYLREWPLSPQTPAIQRRIYDIGVKTITDGQEGFLGVFDYASEGVDELDYLVSAFPHGDLADDALIYMADFEWRDRQVREAIAHLHDLVDNYPTSEWALEGRLRLAKAYRDVNRGQDYDADVLQRAAAEYRTYIELVTADPVRAREYVKQLEAARAELADVEEQLARKRLDVADFYLRDGRAEAARAELKNVLREYPKSRAADEARSRLGIETPSNGGGDQ